MTIKRFQIQGADGAKVYVPLDQGATYDTPVYSLPSGAATSAAQDTTNEVLASIEAAQATEATLASVLASLDITLSALRDALRGANSKTFSDLATLLNGGLPSALGAGGGLKIDGSGTEVPVNVNTMPINVTASGTIDAAAETVVATLPNGCGTVGLQITGTWVGQLEFEATVDGTNYHPIEASNGITTINATAGNDIFILPGAGYLKTRVRASAWTSGAAA